MPLTIQSNFYNLIALLFAPVPCSPSINKSSAYHFGPIRVRILLAQNRVMAEDQAMAVQAAVPVAQALLQPPAAPTNVDNPQQNPAPLQVLISFVVICSLNSFSFSPTRPRLVNPRGRLLVPFSSLRKHRVSVVLLISLRLPYPVCTRFICHVLCALLHKHRVCVVLPVFLRLSYPVSTRFICHVLCASPHKNRVCVVFLISLRLLYPVCTRFICHILCASPHNRRV